ncbi:hypothetical protein ACFWWM_00355 [Streptomyces sp. NPDC058682]|uniref:hypothetical protein n=1 Tax=Streptomyces sp. NPDC058682 TaxID=3346596 RepID=UPI0036665F34
MKLAEVVSIADAQGAFLFGGKAAGRKNPKKELVTVRAELLPRGIVKLFSVETGAEVLHSRTGVVVFAGPVTAMPAAIEEKPKAPRKRAVKAPQEPAEAAPEVQEEKPALIPGRAPKNWIELAQSGNTAAARRYWSKRVAEYEG